MPERHGGWVALRGSVPVSASHRGVSASGSSDQGTEWRESRNGVPETSLYPLGQQAAREKARDDEVAAQVAAARAEALRRARERLGPGPLERRLPTRSRAIWELVGDDGGEP